MKNINIEEEKRIFAQNLLYYMNILGLRQKDISTIAGVSAPTVSEWLARKKMPRMDKVSLLAKHFGVNKSDLVEEKEKPAISSERERLIKQANELLGRYSEEDLAWVLQMLERVPPSEK